MQLVRTPLFTGARPVNSNEPVDDSAELAGVVAEREYRNPYFGFRVPFDEAWLDISDEVRAQVAQRKKDKTTESLVLLALAWRPAPAIESGANVMFAVEKFSNAEGDLSGADYLRRLIGQLEHHPDPPKEVKNEPKSTIAGHDFDRLALKRLWGDSEIGMTYWVAVTKGHALVITGSYATPEGLAAIERLLANASAQAAK